MEKLSHPAWVCGLKLCEEAEKEFAPVTPCVGVWIETLIMKRIVVL